jgi:probable rRNA maturation factor
MATSVDLQNDAGFEQIPAPAQFEKWVSAALQHSYARLQQTIRIVDEADSRDLNLRYRGKERATNVLAFADDDDLLDYDCLGDLVICAPVVRAEALEQGKTAESHWAHMVVHGMLHLQGFDHQSDRQAAAMEALEVEILHALGYTNPYND